MPVLFGFANYLVPLMIGARDMAFPRLNAFSFWLTAFGGLLLYFQFSRRQRPKWRGNAPDVGWWAYSPLPSKAFSPGHSADYWTISLLVSGFGSIGTAINIIATVLCMRCPGMQLGRMPLLVWLNLVMSGMVLIAVTPLSAAQLMLLVDRYLGGHFFDTQAGGSATLWMHFFWVFGATDPLAGQVALMAEAKAIGKLFKDGWRPRRTLVYASWDGEEPGLLGSTEWVEQHADELKAKAALYVNSDTNGRGYVGVSGSHALQHFASEAARDVKDPETGASVLARAVAKQHVAHYDAAAHGSPSAELELGALGSGSDFTPFLQHLGVNSLDVGFEGEADYGVYHSAYDSFDHFRRFVDPTFEYGVALAKVAGRLMLRAAQAQLLPAKESDFAASIAAYDDELHKLADGMRAKTLELSKLLDEDAYKLAADPMKPRAAPPRAADVPYLNFAELDNADREAHAEREGIRRGIRAPCGHRRRGRRATAGECGTDGSGAGVDRSARVARPRLVSAHDLRAGFPYRIRRENAARHSRGDRRAPLG